MPRDYRDLLIADDARDICPDCGLLTEQCRDEHARWYPQRTICHVSMQQQAAERRYRELHEEEPFHDGTFRRWSKDADAGHPFHFMDGVRVWVAPVDVNPDDDFLT